MLSNSVACLVKPVQIYCSKNCILLTVSDLSFCRRFPLYLVFVGASLLFLLVNLACALLVKMTDAQIKTIVLVRVTINDSLFVLCAISLSVCLYKVAKMSLASIYLESKVCVSRAKSKQYIYLTRALSDLIHSKCKLYNKM